MTKNSEVLLVKKVLNDKNREESEHTISFKKNKGLV